MKLINVSLGFDRFSAANTKLVIQSKIFQYLKAKSIELTKNKKVVQRENALIENKNLQKKTQKSVFFRVDL